MATLLRASADDDGLDANEKISAVDAPAMFRQLDEDESLDDQNQGRQKNKDHKSGMNTIINMTGSNMTVATLRSQLCDADS